MDWQTVFVVFGGAGIGALAVWCGWLTNRMDARVEERRQAIDAIARGLNDYKLEVAEKYASVAHLKDVEQRLVAELSAMNRHLADLAAAVNRMQGWRGRRAGDPEGWDGSQ